MDLIYPKTIKENYEYRAELLYKSSYDPDLKSAIKAQCEEDILFWINTFCWTFDPRPGNQQKLGYDDANLLFITWDFQDKYIHWLQEKIGLGENGVVEKSRDMGVSWITLAVFQHYWQFGGAGNDFRLGSRKEDFVDKIGEMDALFPKLRYMIKRQPKWLLPEGFNPEKHMSFMKIKNPQTESTITGESNNQYFGTGGRKKAVFYDEFAKWEHTDESAWQSASDVTDCKIAVSSANGRSNHFYRLRSQKAGKVDVYRIHWSSHPLKDRAWYEKEKQERSKKDLAAEVDIDYSASISNKAWENFSYDVHVTTSKLYNPELPIVLACDFNIEPMSWVLLHEHPPMSLIFDELVDQERTRTEYHIQDFCNRYHSHRNKMVYIYGDASGKHGHTSSKKSNYQIIQDTLKSRGWKFQMYVPRSNPAVSERLDASNKRLRDWKRKGESFVLINEKCIHLIDSLEQTKSKGDGIDKTDNIEHAAEAWSYYEVYKFPISRGSSHKTKLTGT